MAQNGNETEDLWGEYYKMSAGRPARYFLHRTLKRFDTTGLAVDLGCGVGTESTLLLLQGWDVVAVDQQEKAIQTLLTTTSPGVAERLQTLVAPFEAVTIPPADLIWAGLSLPFCNPGYFDALWDKIRSALNSGGRFAGDFFGPRHAWSGNPKMTFHTREEVNALCEGLYLEYIVEEEGEEQTALDGVQHWHMFTIRARAP